MNSSLVQTPRGTTAMLKPTVFKQFNRNDCIALQKGFTNLYSYQQRTRVPISLAENICKHEQINSIMNSFILCQILHMPFTIIILYDSPGYSMR